MQKRINESKQVRYELLEKQAEAWNLLADQTNGVTEVLYGGSAGGGKTRLGVMWLIYLAQTYPGTRYLMGRAVLQRLRETTLRTFIDVCREFGISYVINQHQNYISFDNGSEIFLKDLKRDPGDPEYDSLGSLEVTAAFVDEAAEVDEKAKAIIMSRIRYRLDEFGLRPKLLATTNPCKTWPYQQFYKPWSEGTLAPHRRFVRALPGDNRFLPASYVATFESQPKSIRDRLLLGKWEQDDDPLALFAYDDILFALDNRALSVVKAGRTVGTLVGGVEDCTPYITVDVARQGEDSTCICLWRGMYLADVRIRSRLMTDEVAREVRELAGAEGVMPGHVIVDADGVGGGVVDQLRGCVSFHNNARPLHDENYANLKSQCYFALAELVIRREVSFAGCPEQVRRMILEELEVVRRKDSDDLRRVAVVPKDEMRTSLGRSPDVADALMLRMWPHVRRRRGVAHATTVHVVNF